ncbi:hypothetical protein LK540_05980 [Massilia sp. IC2-278]|uniref:hypothetical protein n=1 Tax=Massilia sp. IC2-278 TaxID=2887200 RepID=UPI001E5D61EF|nr:hypothetical protein [Massilia sp. IC2-278]MCC2959977.1 hypothetical protein [Massilia sp. IC2-278]
MTKLSHTGADAYKRMLEIFNLLTQTSSISVVSGYLKSKGLKHSAGSWDDLLTKRIQPAFSDNQISLEELMDLLRHAEESGRQHVFLYESKPDLVKAMLDQAAVMQKLAVTGIAHVAAAPLIVAETPVPQIVDVRWENKALLVKIVAQRIVPKLDETIHSADGFNRNYKLVPHRVVHLFRLHPNGILELRVASHSTSTRYTEDISRLFAMLDFLLPLGNFKPYSLRKAKEYIWKNKENLGDRLRVVDSMMKNDDGYALRGIATSDDGNVGTDPATTQSLDLFRGKDGYCDSLNLYFLPHGDPAFPTKEIHVILPSVINEFAVPGRCSHVEFEHIFNEIRAFNA